MCEPLPRTMKGGSPPTARNARTGEFTPPGIMLSARCCRRRDCSTLRDIVDGIELPRSGNSLDSGSAAELVSYGVILNAAVIKAERRILRVPRPVHSKGIL